MPITFGPLEESDDRTTFVCERPELTNWFHTRAGQDRRRDMAQTFVARDEHGIAGYYTLSAFSFLAADLPADLTRKLPRYDTIPAVLIGRLARHQRLRGSGFGELLMADAFERILELSTRIAMHAVVVDAKDEGVKAFYMDFGFQPFPSRELRLFLPLASVRAAG